MLEFTANEVNQHVLADGNGMNDAFEFKAEMGGRVRERERQAVVVTTLQ